VSAVDVSGVTVEIDGHAILQAVTSAIEQGGWLAIIGPNGAGKTTLLRAVAGLVAYEGTIVLGGVDARSMTRRQRSQHVAMVPQRPLLPPAMTVAEYVLLGRTPYIAYFDTETGSDLAIVHDALARLDIASFASRPLGTLSGGEQQRVVLARALAQQAPILLLDEGTSALDVGAQQHVMELVDVMRRTDGLTVISALHDLTLAAQYAGRLALLSGGRVAAEGSPADVIREDLIAAHYGAEVRIDHSEDGISVVPVRRRAEQRLGPIR